VLTMRLHCAGDGDDPDRLCPRPIFTNRLDDVLENGVPDDQCSAWSEILRVAAPPGFFESLVSTLCIPRDAIEMVETINCQLIMSSELK
jgi:hypothetical protein